MSVPGWASCWRSGGNRSTSQGSKFGYPGERQRNGDPRSLPIYGDMGPRLNMAKTERDLRWPDCPWVFHEQGQRLFSFRKAWASACKRANLPGLLFHDLRRSAVRNMIRAGIPEKVAMTISGHKTRAMIERYNIVSGRDLAEVGIKMEQYFATLGKVTGKVKQKPAN
jgi:integrase